MRVPLCLPILAALLLSGVPVRASGATSKSCESLTAVGLPHTKIALAQTIPAGGFTPPAGAGTATIYKDLPPFCRVVADVMPTADSDIRIELWMPTVAWNGKFQGQGSGGFGGSINYTGLAGAVKRGYASAATGMGHTGSGLEAGWALGHPDKVIDWGYRAVHEMTLKAKRIIDDFYDRAPKYSYFAGCSDGGREALMEVQRFPTDYDGVIAGAPSNYATHLASAWAWNQRAITDNPASYIPASKLPAVSKAVLTTCDARDGVSDGILNDPRQCDSDPSILLCKGAESDACLTEPQVTALKKIYAGPIDSAGKRVYPGLVPGDEQGWAPWVMGTEPGQGLQLTFVVQYFANMVYDERDWNLRSFSIDQSPRVADQKTSNALNATNPNLSAFKRHGGKLILYHGWNDAGAYALNTINYYSAVVEAMGQSNTDSFLRLFMMPGVEHCDGGPGPNYVGQDGQAKNKDPEGDIYRAIERWLENGVAPTRIIATKYADDSKPGENPKMTRPLCPYPQVAKYRGTGDTNDASNFVCANENN